MTTEAKPAGWQEWEAWGRWGLLPPSAPELLRHWQGEALKWGADVQVREKSLAQAIHIERTGGYPPPAGDRSALEAAMTTFGIGMGKGAEWRIKSPTGEYIVVPGIKERVEAERKFLAETIRLQARAEWFYNFYNIASSLVASGDIVDLDDYLRVMMSDPTGILSPEDLDAAREALVSMGTASKSVPGGTDVAAPGGVREDAPDFLKTTPEEEEEVREFLRARTKPLPLAGVHELTIQQLMMTFKKPPAELPEGWTDEQLLAFAALMDIPEGEMTKAIDMTELIKPYSEAISEREEQIKSVLEGLADWEEPQISFWEKAGFAFLSPMQVAADVIKPYLEAVSYPIAGFAAYTVQRMMAGTQDLEKSYRELKASGKGWWGAMSEAWQAWELPWYYKLPLEIVTDPITYIPGLLLSVPGKLLSRAPSVGVRVLGSGMLSLNRGLWHILDIPFDAFKGFWASIPKSFNQAARFELNNFRDLLIAAATKQSGKVVNRLGPEDFAAALERAVAGFASNPRVEGDIFIDLGRELAKHVPLGTDDVLIWSKSLGGKLTAKEATKGVVASVNDVIHDTIIKVGNPVVNAKRMAIALMVEDSPLVIGKLIKDMSVITGKYASRVAKAIAIGKAAKLNPVMQMTEFLVSGQKAVIQAFIRSPYAEGKFMSGVILSLMNKVDKLERGVFRTTLDRWLVRPVAEAYLGSVAYPVWNAFEGIFVSVMEGVVPRQAKQAAFQRMFLGVRGIDSRVAAWSASDVAGMLGTMPGREGSISLLPGKFPEKVVGLKTPKWISGKDWFEWTGRKWIELSDVWGTALRANFLMRKMASYLAEYSYNVAGRDINAAFKQLIGKPPSIGKKSLGLTEHELKQEMFVRLSSGLKTEVLGMKELLSNSSLTQGEALKILRQATEISPQAKTLGEQIIARGEALKTTDDVINFCRTLADQSVADLKAFPTQVPDSFRFMADQIDRLRVETADDLMQVFQHYEVMADTASRAPMRLLSQVFEEADELKRLGKFNQLEKLWRTSRADVDNIVSGVSESLARVRAVIQGKSGLLKDKEQIALNSLLERNTARITLQEQFLRFDGRLLDDFWALPKAVRTSEEHAALRAYRWENITKYRGEDAVLSGGDFLSRKSYAQLYYDLPAPKLIRVDASTRALSADDCAKVMNCNVDALTTGIMESMTFQDRAYFIQAIKQSADANPSYFKGFTEEKISQVYDDMLRGMKMSPEVDIATQKILQQVEGVKQRMMALRMTKSLNPAEEKSLHGWIDDVAKGMDDIFEEVTPAGAVKPPKEVVTGKSYEATIYRGKKPGVAPVDEGLYGRGTYYTTNRSYAETYGVVEESSVRLKNPYVIKSQAEANTFWDDFRPVREQAIQEGRTMREADELVAIEMRKSLEAQGYDGVIARNIIEEGDEVVVFHPKESIMKPTVPKKGVIIREAWGEVRQKASESAHKEYYKAFADYTNENLIDVMGKAIYPYWTYHMYRWFFLPRTFLRKPGVMAAWGKYYEYSDYGYVHIPGTDLEFSPFVGSAFGTTFSLARHDFKSYYENLGFLGEVLDFTQRRGFFPGIHMTLPVVVSPIFSGRPPEFGEALPPLHRVGLNLLVASNIPGVADAAKWLKDRVFHENFHDYYTATIVSSKQVEAGGKLIEGQAGVDLWFKIMRGEKLTEDEQAVWDEAYDEAALYAVLRSEFPGFRMRAEEMLEAYKQVTKMIEEQLGMTEEFQDNLWRHNLRPTDVVGGLPLDLRMAMDEMWQWRIYFGRGAILMPPEYSNLYGLMNKYWDKVEGYQEERLRLQADTDTGFLFPTKVLHFDGREWRREYANNWSTYGGLVESLESDPEYADAVDAMTPEGQARLMKELGFSVPPFDPMQEAINLYFDIELEKKTDPYTGEEDYDYLGFWLEREAVRMALTEDQRADFDAYIQRYLTPMELLFRRINNTYFRGYRAVTRIVLEEFSDEEKALIAEFYADDTTRERKEEIKSVTSAVGRKLISDWDSRRTAARAALRQVSPHLDFWLYVFGYITSPKTDEAKAMIDTWEKDKSSILLK